MTKEKIHILADNDDIILMFGLLGIESTIVENNDDLKKEFNNLIKKPNIGMIIISAKISEYFNDFLIDYKLTNRKPFIFYLPDIFIPDTEEKEIFLKKINESIGKIIN